MNDSVTKITLNEQIAGGFFRLRFAVDWNDYEPGQFVMLTIPGGEVFLRRPFGIVRISKKMAEVCYKVVGRGTGALSRACVGSRISALGPCGRGFSVPKKGETLVLAAGGYGIAPLFGLAQRAIKMGRTVVIYYGARSKDHILYLDELKGIGAKLHLTTEDGSMGEKGVITKRLKCEIADIVRPSLFSCGPCGLIEEIARLGMRRGLKTQVSLETSMACGLGVCLGCVCKDSQGNYVRVCREGPVFEARDLSFQ